MQVNVKELSNKYSMSEQEVIEIIQDSISDYLKTELDEDVQCIYKKELDEFKIYKYDDILGFQNEVSLNKISRKMVIELLEVVQGRLIYHALEGDFNYYYKLAGELVVGKVVKIKENNDILVEITDSITKKSILCDYPIANQPHGEIGYYELNERYVFYVLRVVMDTSETIPRLKIILSRKSKSLTELLIKKELLKRGIYDVEVNCVKRIANDFSGVIVNKKIPNEVIKQIADFLQERVIVRYFKKPPTDEKIYTNQFWKRGTIKEVEALADKSAMV